MSENFSILESQKSYENLDKSEVVYLLEKSRFTEKSLDQKVSKLRSRISTLEALIAEMKQGHLDITEPQITTQQVLFEKSSEKSTKEEIAASNNEDLRIPGTNDPSSKKETQKRVLKPSERYRNLEIKKTHIVPENQKCPCCSHNMVDSGLTEETERLSVIPKQYFIDRHIKHKFKCNACSGLATPAALPSIVSGGAFSDLFVIDVTVAKFCDLVPISRYVKVAARLGVEGLPDQSLIEGTHQLAHYLRGVYRLLKKEVLESKLVFADETTHRMLEGHDKESWWLWSFSTETAAYFDLRDTRSGDVASQLLKNSKCEFLSSDVFSGYGKAVREANEYRIKNQLPLIANVYCNAHARRKFRDAEKAYKMASTFFIDRYRSIYFLESQLTELRNKDPDVPPDKILEIRAKMRPFFEEMKAHAQQELFNYPDTMSIAKAMNYLVNHYDKLTLFLSHPDVPIDNNRAERILRNPVIGRKTWFGTHSVLGAETTAVLFSIIESCKLNGVNPNVYLKAVVQALHQSMPVFTPKMFAQKQN